MIVNIRGTSGSGKTTVAYGLMALAEAAGYRRDVLLDGKGRPQDYAFSPPTGPALLILGRYETPTGGCDTIKTQDEVCGRIRHYAGHGHHVVFEGLLISHLFSRYRDLDRALQPTPYIWACLDTPLDVCLARVQARRDARGKAKGPLNPQNTIAKWHDLYRVHEKCLAAGLDSRLLAHETAATEIWGWLTCPSRT